MTQPVFQPTSDDRVCVIIPMYRVAAHIQGVIRGLPDWVWRVVVVDDASPDDSAALALAVGDPRVVLVRNPRNLGVGGAVLAGFNAALAMGAAVMVKMDGDGQMRPEYLERMVAPILAGRANYVKGNRFYHTRNIAQMPPMRRAGNMALSFMTKMASGYWNVFDPTNGYLAIDAQVFQELDQERIHPRYFFESSMLVELNLARAVVTEVTMPAHYAGEKSSLSLGRVLLEFPGLLVRGFVRRIWFQYFVLDFSVGSLLMVLGALMTLFGAVWGGIWWRNSILTGRTASTGTVMLAALPLILGFELLLQALIFDVQNTPRAMVERVPRRAPAADEKEMESAHD